MNEAFHQNLKDIFAKISSLFTLNPLDYNKFDAVVEDLKISGKQIAKHGNKMERKLLPYCIDALLKFIEEGDKEKICSFADLCHDIPDIFLGMRNFYSFGKEIKMFNEKYREDCFIDMKITPYFSKKAPKNFLEYFSPESDEEFRAEHPIGYGVLVFFGILAFLLLLILYLIYLCLFDNKSAGGWPMLGILGCFVMGVGLFNIVAAFIHQYLGHKLTAICLLGGGAFVALSIFMTCHTELYDEKVSLFYFLSLTFMLLPAFYYVGFRFEVGNWLKKSKRIKNSEFDKLTEGKRNFWWYEALHEKVNMGFLYYLNKAFTIFFALTFVLTLLTGFIKEMSLILCPMHVILHVLTAFMVMFYLIQNNLALYGKPFVLFAKKGRRIDSVIKDLIMVLFTLALAYVNVMLVGDIWGVEIPHLLQFRL